MAKKKQSLSTAQKLVIEYYKAKLNLMHVLNTRWAAASALDLFQKPHSRPSRKDPAIWKQATKLTLTTGTEALVGYHWASPNPSGKQLLVAHGFAGNCRSFDRIIRSLVAKGYDVIAYDAPGHGKSTGSRLNLLTYKWVLEDIIKQHGKFDAYIAHSLGGMSLMLALENLGLHHQEKIVLIAPLIEAHRAAENFGRFLQLPNSLMGYLQQEIELRAGHPLHWYSLPRLVQQHKGQILWIHDKDDVTTPYIDMTEIMNQSPLHVDFFITEGLGHSRIYRDNKVRKKVLESL